MDRQTSQSAQAAITDRAMASGVWDGLDVFFGFFGNAATYQVFT
jgi:hypothetical protein